MDTIKDLKENRSANEKTGSPIRAAVMTVRDDDPDTWSGWYIEENGSDSLCCDDIIGYASMDDDCMYDLYQEQLSKDTVDLSEIERASDDIEIESLYESIQYMKSLRESAEESWMYEQYQRQLSGDCC